MCQTYKYRYICSHAQIESTPCDYRDSGVGSWPFRRVCSKFSSFSYIRALCPPCRKATKHAKQQVRFTVSESKVADIAIDEVIKIIVRNERLLARRQSNNNKAVSVSHSTLSFATPSSKELEYQYLINDEFLARRQSSRLFYAVNRGKALYDDFLDEHYYHAHLKGLIKSFNFKLQNMDHGTQTDDSDTLFSVCPSIVYHEEAQTKVEQVKYIPVMTDKGMNFQPEVDCSLGSPFNYQQSYPSRSPSASPSPDLSNQNLTIGEAITTTEISQSQPVSPLQNPLAFLQSFVSKRLTDSITKPSASDKCDQHPSVDTSIFSSPSTFANSEANAEDSDDSASPAWPAFSSLINIPVSPYDITRLSSKSWSRVRDWERLNWQLRNNWPKDDTVTSMDMLPQNSLAFAAKDLNTHDLIRRDSDPDTAAYEELERHPRWKLEDIERAAS